jgi:ribosome-binding protein aMBF1 (putative translation factor)
MSDAERKLQQKQAQARAHPVRRRILEVFPKDRGETPTASAVVELFGKEFRDLTIEKASYHLSKLGDADLLARPEHRGDQDIQLAKGVGTAVQELRLERGLSTEELAQRAELPHSDVVAIEAGTAEEYWGDLRRLAAALGVAVESLIAAAEELADERVDDDGGDGGAPPSQDDAGLG